MINPNMKLYSYFTLGEANSYGQAQIPDRDAEPVGQVKMAICTLSQSAADNVRYKDASYIGLTHAPIDDTYIIQYGSERLKVLYIETAGRYKQVFLGAMV